MKNFLEEKEPYQIQGSPEWHAFRKKHIGASEVPAIMGTCDFKTIEDIRDAKTGEPKPNIDNFAIRRGKALEHYVIARLENIHRVRLTNPVAVHPVHSFLSASLDGWDEARRIIYEVKVPSRVKHTMALCGLVPETYEDQLQAQIFVFDATKAIYVSYNEDEPEEFDLAQVEVYPNEKRQQEIVYKCQEFWESLK